MTRAILLAIVFLIVSGVEARAESLERRVDDLERAVARLQERCSSGHERDWEESETESVIWTCTVRGHKETFYGNGKTRGLAEREAMEACKAASDICRVKECSDE